MKKTSKKLLATIGLLVIAACMLVSVSYAWLTVSNNPAVNGIQVSVGGGQTILLAADVTEVTEDGSILHYPGTFDSKLIFSQYDVYAYLSEVGALRPTSTADGSAWMMPAYYSITDDEVQSGTAYAGQLRPVTEFTVDSSLQNANLSETEAKEAGGCYVYLDFWIVSPGSEYQLRVSTGSDGGSFVIGLPYPTEDSSTLSGYTLGAETSGLAASARVGFLVNTDIVQDGSMLAYQRSGVYSTQYAHLLGVYAEKGAAADSLTSQFTIYEPNGTLHTKASGLEEGSYAVTEPLLYSNGQITTVDIRSNLTVQTQSTWKQNTSAGGLQLEGLFQTALTGKTVLSTAKAFSLFYRDYLQGQVAAYVSNGEFFDSTANLYAYADAANTATVAAETLSGLKTSGATEDVYITQLERNIPQRVRMFIWLEGQDVDCVSEASLSGLALNIELAGSR